MRIKTAKEARQFVGKQVYWDDVGVRYIFLRSGIIEGVEGRHVIINGDYKVIRNLTNLRDNM